MKKLLLVGTALLTLVSGSAMAADLGRPAPAPVYTKAPPPAPLFTWTGFYIGGNIGAAWAQHNWNDNFFGLNFNNGTSNAVFIGGGQVGGNYQINNFVIGVEGTFDWAANNNNNNIGVIVPAGILGIGGHTLQVTANDKWIATVAARLGVAYDRVLFYAKGGGAWVGANSLTITDVNTGASITGSTNNTLSGFLVGGGIEWAFTNNWTVKAEYDYIGLGNRTFTVPVGAPFPVLVGDTFTTSGTNNVQMATVGINFLFGGGRY
jgi:outer membrane immunogenic protein